MRAAQTQFSCRVKRLYADGGSEFINQTLQKFCDDGGIELHPTPPRTQQLNGISERGVRTVKEKMHTMMLVSSMHPRFWSYAAGHSVYIWNRTTTDTVTGVTPFEAMLGRKPSMRHWSVFGPQCRTFRTAAGNCTTFRQMDFP